MKLMERVGGVFKNGFVLTKGVARKAGRKAAELGSMGAIKIESAQLKSELDDLSAKLGHEVYSSLMDKNIASVTRDTPGIAELVKALGKLHKRLAAKDREYSAIGETAKAGD